MFFIELMNGLLVFMGKSVVMSLDLFSYLCVCAQSCLTFCDPRNCSPPGSTVDGIFPGKNTGVGCHFLLQGIFPNQGLNPGLLCLWHWQADSLPLCHLGSPLLLGHVSKQITWLHLILFKGCRGPYHMIQACGIWKSKLILCQRQHTAMARAWAQE